MLNSTVFCELFEVSRSSNTMKMLYSESPEVYRDIVSKKSLLLLTIESWTHRHRDKLVEQECVIGLGFFQPDGSLVSFGIQLLSVAWTSSLRLSVWDCRDGILLQVILFNNVWVETLGYWPYSRSSFSRRWLPDLRSTEMWIPQSTALP